MSTLDLNGRVAIVTGAGNGIGRTHALELARRGAKVVANDLGGNADGSGHSASPAHEVVSEIEDSGGEAVAETSSVATVEGAASIVATAIQAFGRVDILINNAGILRDRSLLKLTEEDWNAVVDVHLKGSFLVSQAVFGHMKEQGYVRLVHTTSAAGLFGNFGQSNYSAAKMGIVGLSRTISLEGEKYGITSNVVAPVAKTRLTEDLLGPFAALLDVNQVTSIVAVLASEQCPVSGEVFSVVGGRYARVFTAVTPGWFAGAGSAPTGEDVLAHFDEIRAEAGYSIPAHAFEELSTLQPLLTGGGDAS